MAGTYQANAMPRLRAVVSDAIFDTSDDDRDRIVKRHSTELRLVDALFEDELALVWV